MCGFFLVDPVSVMKATWGGFFFRRIKTIRAHYQPGRNSFGLRIVERGKDHLRLIFLGRDVLSMLWLKQKIVRVSFVSSETLIAPSWVTVAIIPTRVTWPLKRKESAPL